MFLRRAITGNGGVERADALRQNQRHAEQNGQCPFHVVTINAVGRSRQTFIGFRASTFGVLFGRGVFVGFVSRADFLDILGWILVEVLLAIFAAEFDFLAFIFNDEW